MLGINSSKRCLIALASMAVVAATLFAGATTLARAASRSASNCNPGYKFCDPGKLHAGVYTTRYFLHGMRVNVPSSGWVSHQDSTTEFSLTPPGYTGPSTGANTPPIIRFWIDPRVGTPCTDKILPTKPTTPASAVRWLTTNKNFVVSGTGRTTIAGHLAALTLDYDVSPNAPKCDPSCPSSCIDYFDFLGGPGPDSTDVAPGHTPGIKDGFGTGAGDPVRLYFAHIGQPSHSHLFMVGVETPNGKDQAALRAAAATMLADLRLPTRLPRTGKR
jgi:hypothetical protein